MEPYKTDEQLMLEFQRGDSSSFESLVARHQKGVYNFIFRYVGNKEEAEELLQDVFLKIYKGVSDYVPVGKFKTWLFTVTRNLCVDHYRKKKIRRTESLDEVREDTETSRLEYVQSDGEDPEGEATLAQLDGVVMDALSKLNEDQKEVFLLREKFGFKFEEIAAMTGVSVNTVKSRMRYAVDGVRRVILSSPFRDLLFEEFK